MDTQITKLQKFLLVLTLLSIGIAVCGYLICKQYVNKNIPVSSIIGVFYMFVPAISVLIIEKWNFKKISIDYQIRFQKINIVQSFKYILATAFLLPIFVLFFSYLFGNVLGLSDFGFLIVSGEDLDPVFLSQVPFPSLLANLSSRLLIVFPLAAILSLFAGCTVNLFFALGEEIAWRGFLEKELFIKEVWKPFLIGIIWGLWHTPLIMMGFNYGEYRILGIFVMVVVCLALAFYFSQALHHSGSLLIPAAMHGIINTTFFYIFVKPKNPLLGPLGLILALSVTSIIFIFWLFRKRTAHEET